MLFSRLVTILWICFAVGNAVGGNDINKVTVIIYQRDFCDIIEPSGPSRKPGLVYKGGMLKSVVTHRGKREYHCISTKLSSSRTPLNWRYLHWTCKLQSTGETTTDTWAGPASNGLPSIHCIFDGT